MQLSKFRENNSKQKKTNLSTQIRLNQNLERKSNSIFISDKGKVKIGKPTIKGSKVTGEVLSQFKDDKVIVFKKKRRKGYKVKNGHRQKMTKILIKEIK